MQVVGRGSWKLSPARLPSKCTLHQLLDHHNPTIGNLELIGLLVGYL